MVARSVKFEFPAFSALSKCARVDVMGCEKGKNIRLSFWIKVRIWVRARIKVSAELIILNPDDLKVLHGSMGRAAPGNPKMRVRIQLETLKCK